jgi:hypothetical protein
MSIPFTSIFTKIGAMGGILNLINASRGTTVPAKIAALDALFSAEPIITDGIYSSLSSYQGSSSSLPSYLQSLAVATVIADVNGGIALSDRTIGAALSALVSGMRSGGQSVSAATISSATTANAGNTGTPSIAVGLKSKSGYPLDTVFAESIAIATTGDGQSSSATVGQEPLSLRGQPPSSNPLNYDYPAGSGSSSSVNAVDASLSQVGGTGNFLNNSSFEAFTGSIPNFFTITAGAGQITKSTAAGTFYAGLASLAIAGDGTTLTALNQQFGISTGTTVIVSPITQYSFNFWAKVSSVPAAGVLEIALVDGSGTILTDVAGNNSAATFSIPAMTTTFAAFSGFLRTPRVMPAATYLRIRLSTALSAGSTIFVDRLAFTQPTSLYRQGPSVAVFSGATPLIVGDGWSTAVANNYAGGFQVLFDRLFGMKSLGLLLPTSGSPTQADSLIA